MTIWLARLTLTSQEEAAVESRSHLALPFGELPDLSLIHSEVECRHLLQALYPGEPPESIARRAERIWPLYAGMHPEDIIAVPLQEMRQVALAEVTGGYRYQVGEDGADVHLVPVKWHVRRVPFRALRRHAELLSVSGPAMSEIGNVQARTILRERLPHRYNRFVKWKWLLGVFFVMNMLRFVQRFLHH